MRPDEPVQSFDDLDPEIESFRRALEVSLEEEKARLREEQGKALERIRELSENSIALAESEWEKYDEMLHSSKESFIEELRGRMSYVLDPVLDRMMNGDLVERAVSGILPAAYRERKEGCRS
ncbi:MAG TPA: hypothetical protein DDW96_03720 [Synergistaceae bacterium]|nr:MAG: hypothetical protein XD83_0389 [Synergistales bacterium 57_84]KUK88826.1 MAG: hypothetical protein XE01_0277 [Synergistales bacterium 58_81]HBG14416.1 hypothetical protein [Synergistaceae bacterium]